MSLIGAIVFGLGAIGGFLIKLLIDIIKKRIKNFKENI